MIQVTWSSISKLNKKTNRPGRCDVPAPLLPQDDTGDFFGSARTEPHELWMPLGQFMKEFLLLMTLRSESFFQEDCIFALISDLPGVQTLEHKIVALISFTRMCELHEEINHNGIGDNSAFFDVHRKPAYRG